MKPSKIHLGMILPTLILLLSCTPEAQQIRYGHDSCANCKMMATDNRFGAEIVLQKGKVYIFDSIECMAAFTAKGTLAASEIFLTLVTPFHHPNTLIDASDAWFLQSENVRSPMGMNLSAYQNKPEALQQQSAMGGQLIQWDAIAPLVETTWSLK